MVGGKKRERREREVDLFSKIGSLTMEVDKSNIRRVGWQTSEQEKLLFQLSPKAVCGRIPLPWREISLFFYIKACNSIDDSPLSLPKLILSSPG